MVAAMHAPEELIGFTPSSVPELTEIVVASCAEFRGEAPAFEEFWSDMGLSAGDFDLTIYRAPVDGGTFLDRCAAYCGKRHAVHQGPVPGTWTRESLERAGCLEPEPEPDQEPQLDEHGDVWEPDEPTDWTGTKVGMTLWHFGHFSSLCWDWKHVNERAGVETEPEDKVLGGYMRMPGGRTFLARVFAQLAWNHGPTDLEAIRQEARATLAELPEPAYGIPRHRFAAMIDGDVARLQALCGANGIVADGLLKDPTAEIRHAMTLQSNGNEERVCFETETEWFGVDFGTS